MVKVINIDTKTRTIRVENAADGDIKTWRTTESGAHFPIKKGESTKEALDKFVEKKRPEAKKDKKKYIEFEEQGQTYRFPKPTKHEKLWDQAWKNVEESRRYSAPAPGGNATAEHTPEETEEEVRAEYKKLKTAERAKQAKEKQQPAKKEFDKELWDKAYEAAKKRVKGVKNPYPTHDEVQSMYEYMQSDDYKKSTEKASFKSAMQTTMKAFPRLYDFEKPHLEEFANKVCEDIQNNPGKEKEVLEHLADAYKHHIAGLGPWVDTPTLAKKAFLDQMLESHLNKQPKQSSQPTSYDLDDAFDEADLGSEWSRAKHRMDFHGVSQYTIKDIIDSGKYEAGDIIEALQSSSHDKIDEMRKSLKK